MILNRFVSLFFAACFVVACLLRVTCSLIDLGLFSDCGLRGLCLSCCFVCLIVASSVLAFGCFLVDCCNLFDSFFGCLCRWVLCLFVCLFSACLLLADCCHCCFGCLFGALFFNLFLRVA